MLRELATGALESWLYKPPRTALVRHKSFKTEHYSEYHRWFLEHGADFRVARPSPMIENIRSCARENLSRSPALSLVSRDLAADEQSQLPPSLLKRSQRKPVLFP